MKATTPSAMTGPLLPRLGLAAALALGLAASPSPAVASAAEALLGATTVSDVAERVSPSVVSITTEAVRHLERPSAFRAPRGRRGPHEFFFGPNGPSNGPFGAPPEGRQIGVASGVIISADGFVVTNNHVVKDAGRVKVKLSDGRELDAKVIGTDEPSDLALVKIDATGLPHLDYGDSSALRLGEIVLAVGNPFGVGETVTMGIVSAKGRSNVGIVDYEDFIQTDAAINPGNSGGALVNLKGELVGVNTAILSQSGGAAGIGFAVPAAMVRPILEQIRSHGSVTRGWLGVAIQDLTPDLARAMNLESKAGHGVVIGDVLDNGPAAKGGMENGDVVVKIDGRNVESASAFRNAIALMTPGTRARLTVLRNGSERDLTVTLAKKDNTKGRADDAGKGSSEGLLSGVELQDLSGDLRRQLEVPTKVSGVVVTNVDPDSLAARAGLREGDVITAVDRSQVKSANEVERLAKGKNVLLRVWRSGTFLFLVLHE